MLMHVLAVHNLALEARHWDTLRVFPYANCYEWTCCKQVMLGSESSYTCHVLLLLLSAPMLGPLQPPSEVSLSASTDCPFLGILANLAA